MRLSNLLLPRLLVNNVADPLYDRSLVKPAILHVGVGNFYRAHLGAYIDDLFNSDPGNEKNSLEWGIVGAGVRSSGEEKRKILESQDWLQTLVQRDATSAQASILGSMIDFLPIDPKAVETALTKDTSMKIVSLVLTEGGYFLDDGEFDPNDPQIQHDIQNPDAPKTIFGIIVKALKARKEASQVPFTVMCGDNIPTNGDVVKSVVVGLASQTDPSLAQWIEDNVAFPNSMVDRITPATTNEQREFVKSEYGYEDSFPVFCEPFRQWILEDNFSDGRPKFEDLENVRFVRDVRPFEFKKIRVLNGGHASLCYPSALLDLEYVDNAMHHPTIAPFLDALEKNEIIPTVPPVPDVSIPEYWETIKGRFSNPTLKDTIPRICFGGASNQPKFTIPVVKDNLEAGRSVDGIALVSAMWCRYCQGKTESGKTIEPNDPQWDRLHETALKARDDPACWLAMHDVYGDTGTNPVFLESFTKALQSLESDGVEAAMNNYTASVEQAAAVAV